MNNEANAADNPAIPLQLPGTTPTWVLLHGAGCDRLFWYNTIEAMRSQGASIFAASMPGRGGVPGPPLKTVEAMAEWVENMLQKHDIQRPIIVGHSLGGGVAQELAYRAMTGVGAPLSGLVLLATGARLRVHPNIFRLMREQSEENGAGGTPISWQPSTDPSLIKAFEARPTPPIGTTFADWKAANGFDRMANLAQIEQLPTLVVGGEADPLTPPRYATYLSDNIVGAQLHLLPDGGHMFPVEQSAALSEVLDRWRTQNVLS